MLKNVLVALVVVLFLMGFSFGEAYAQEEVTCGVSPCEILTEETIDRLIVEVTPRDFVLNYGRDVSVYTSSIGILNRGGYFPYGNAEGIPSRVRIPRHHSIALPQMGVHWWNGFIAYKEPGFVSAGETGLSVPSSNPLRVTKIEEGAPDWKNIRRLRSYYWNGTNILIVFSFVPELTPEELVLHITNIEFTRLIPTGEISKLDGNVKYVNPDAIRWTPGEVLIVEKLFIDSYEVPKEELYDTFWGATRVWVDGYQIRRQNGEAHRISRYDFMALRKCREGENCTESFDPFEGQRVYVDPVTLNKYGFLTVLEKPPYFEPWQVSTRDRELMRDRWSRGEILLRSGTVAPPTFVDSKYNKGWFITLTDGTVTPLRVNHMPPVGSQIDIWYYREGFYPPYSNDLLMAIFADGELWYFNTGGEFGFTFDTQLYPD